jgi:DNA topoisomerase-1
VLSGKYGTYVADGSTNATLPKGVSVEELTFQQALDLLAERAARAPAGRAPRGARRSAPAKPVAEKRPATVKKPAAEKKPVREKKSPAEKRPPKAAKRSAKSPTPG